MLAVQLHLTPPPLFLILENNYQCVRPLRLTNKAMLVPKLAQEKKAGEDEYRRHSWENSR